MPAQKFLDPGSSPAALWGSELRHYRQAAGLSQPELAQKIFCSRQLVGAMETGERSPEPDRAGLCDEALQTGGALRRLLEKLQRSFRGRRSNGPDRRHVAKEQPKQQQRRGLR
ncbi:multiprotein-bridging factor 1 family protein [Actinomadura sp. HBU206391]|uniref:helix-turn-helix domain-containing protein n=1 Tax=Actinomadura sp. HBU206391 TaxID=2731692 RepID=UPI00164F613E|nr:helix-turn-helix transcriptional regulator [Actinomadura sp. HBU206391]MBC6460735.1 helix-turn-helix domain-containing protein [Actinomadura sp. HBU206391]